MRLRDAWAQPWLCVSGEPRVHDNDLMSKISNSAVLCPQFSHVWHVFFFPSLDFLNEFLYLHGIGTSLCSHIPFQVLTISDSLDALNACTDFQPHLWRPSHQYAPPTHHLFLCRIHGFPALCILEQTPSLYMSKTQTIQYHPLPSAFSSFILTCHSPHTNWL